MAGVLEMRTLLSSLEKLKFHVGWHEVFFMFSSSDVLPGRRGWVQRRGGDRGRARPGSEAHLHWGLATEAQACGCPVPHPA